VAVRARGDGPRARRALRRLLRAGRRGDQDAIDGVWAVWYDRPDDAVWAALAGWRRPRTEDGLSLVALGEPAANADVIAAARRVGHPIADTARATILAGKQELVEAVCTAAMSEEDGVLSGFCAEHALAPVDPPRAVLFYLVTGQLERYRSADPDHSLLALAYRGAPEVERARIRQRVAGEPDLVRVLATTVTGHTEPEARYLVDALAERRDWPTLWGLVRDLPVHHAAAAVHRFDGWRPDGADGALFDHLVAADFATHDQSWASVATPWTVRVSLADQEAVTRGSMAPDGQRFAVSSRNWVEAFALTDRVPQGLRQERVSGSRSVLVLADGFVVVEGGNHLFYGVDALVRTASGYAGLSFNWQNLARLYLYRHGPSFPRAKVVDLHEQLGIVRRAAIGPWTMAASPDGGLLAFAGEEHLHIARLDTVPHRVATVPFMLRMRHSLAFCGPDRVVGVDAEHVVRIWQLTGTELRVVAQQQLDRTADWPVHLPGAGVIAVLSGTGSDRRVRYLDDETLADRPVPDWLTSLRPTCLLAPPDGARLALGGNGWVTVTDTRLGAEVTELVGRPLAASGPADLSVVRAQLDRLPTDSDVRPAIELLRTCLEHRFSTDIRLGSAKITGQADDIALGGSA
jgi:hypothetical protein